MDSTSWLKEMVQVLNDLDQVLNHSESPIGKIDTLVTEKYLGKKEYETALKACNLSYLNPRVDRLRILLEDLRDVQKDTN